MVITFIVDSVYRKRYKFFWVGLYSFLAIFSIAAVVLSAQVHGAEVNSKWAGIALFFGVLPVVNSFFDWISLVFTRVFLFKLYNGSDSCWQTVALAVIDLLLALFFMLVLIAGVVTVIALINELSFNFTGGSVFDLTAIFKNLHSGESWQDNLWIHFMMLSTLVPTFLHFIFALIGLLMPLLSPLTKDKLIELKQFKPKKLNDKIFWATTYRKPIVVFASLAIVVGICSPIYYHGDVAFDFFIKSRGEYCRIYSS